MTKLTFSVTILAPREKVWTTMLAEESYRQWHRSTLIRLAAFRSPAG